MTLQGEKMRRRPAASQQFGSEKLEKPDWTLLTFASSPTLEIESGICAACVTHNSLV